MPSGRVSWVDPINDVLDGSRAPTGRGNFGGKRYSAV